MTNAEARFNKSLRPRKPEGSLGRTVQDGHLDSHTAPELCISSRCVLCLSSPAPALAIDHVQCCFTSTETVRLKGRRAHDGHPDFHTAPELRSEFSVALRPQRPSGLLGTDDGHLDFHTAPEFVVKVQWLYVHRYRQAC